MIRYIAQKSLHLLYIGCFIIFVIQVAVLIYNRMNPSQTISSTSQKQLADLKFPVIFKICIKPAFDDEELNKLIRNIRHGLSNTTLRHSVVSSNASSVTTNKRAVLMIELSCTNARVVVTRCRNVGPVGHR